MGKKHAKARAHDCDDRVPGIPKPDDDTKRRTRTLNANERCTTVLDVGEFDKDSLRQMEYFEDYSEALRNLAGFVEKVTGESSGLLIGRLRRFRNGQSASIDTLTNCRIEPVLRRTAEKIGETEDGIEAFGDGDTVLVGLSITHPANVRIAWDAYSCSGTIEHHG